MKYKDRLSFWAVCLACFVVILLCVETHSNSTESFCDIIYNLSSLSKQRVSCIKSDIAKLTNPSYPFLIAVHRETDNVFIGNRNQLIKLNSNLDILGITTIDKNATFGDHEPDVIKILLVYGDQIVICTTHRPECFMRSVHNISLEEFKGKNDFISRAPNASTVAFIAHPGEHTMYVAEVYDTDGKRLVNRMKLYDTQQNKNNLFNGLTSLIDDPNVPTDFVKYIYGFSARYSYRNKKNQGDKDYFKYFLTESNGYKSKLHRLKDKYDDGFAKKSSTIKCSSGTNNYPFLRAAHLTEPDFFLSASFNLTHQPKFENLVLYAIFSENQDASGASALCVYSLKSLNEHLDKEETISAIPVATFDKQLTSIIATRVSGISVAFVGTVNGYLLKVGVQSNKLAHTYADINIQENFPIIALRFDSTEQELYALTQSRVVKVSTHDDCSIFKLELEEFLNSKIPSCGYCSSNKSNTTKEYVKEIECVDDDHSTISWKNYYWNASCGSSKMKPIDITTNPIFVPYDVPNEFTISSSSFDAGWLDPFVKVKIAEIDCKVDIYSITEQSFKCTLLSRLAPGHGRILIQKNCRAFKSNEDVVLFDALIKDFNPKVGAISGGTEVIINGISFYGENIRVFVGKTECVEIVVENDGKRLRCVMNKMVDDPNGERSFKLEMRFGNAKRSSRESFRFEDDPTITSVSSNLLDKTPPKGYPDGGSDIYIPGRNLRNTQDPQFYVIYEGDNYYSTICYVESNTLMICKSPRIGRGQTLVDPQNKTLLDYGVRINHRHHLHNITSNPVDFPKFELTKNPSKEILLRTIFIFCVVLGIGIISIGLIAKRINDRKDRELADLVEKIKKECPDSMDTSKPLNTQAHCIKWDGKWECSRKSVYLRNIAGIYTMKIGGGNFGYVYEGRPNQIFYGETYLRKIVAVKKPIQDHKAIVALIKEIKIMTVIPKHPNILRLLGAVSEGGLMMIVEHAKHGSLKNVLLSSYNYKKPAPGEYIPIDMIGILPLTKSILLNWAEQIADGMIHLTECNIYHRDLAARNVLVFDQNLVKIADFGLSIDKYFDPKEDDFNLAIPPESAPETILENTFNERTDVYSFGHVLWTIFNHGKSKEDSKERYPQEATQEMFYLIERCWSKTQELRPSFKTIKREIQAIRRVEESTIHNLEDEAENTSQLNIVIPIENDTLLNSMEMTPLVSRDNEAPA